MLKNLRSLFIIEEEGPEKEKNGKKEKKEKETIVPSKETKIESVEGEPGKVSGQFLEVLFKAMENHNAEGFDYLEYKNSLRSLEKMPLDEPTRYQSAFAMAQTMGATPEKLLQTAQHYIDILKQEEDKFEVVLAQQKALKIGEKQKEMNKLEETIRQKAEEIRRLTQEMEKHQNSIDQLNEEIREATVRIETTKNDFIASYNSLVSQIESDRERMQKYLK